MTLKSKIIATEITKTLQLIEETDPDADYECLSPFCPFCGAKMDERMSDNA